MLNRIFNAVKLDFMVLKGNIKQIVLASIIVLAFGFVGQEMSATFIILTMFIAVSFTGMTFAISEKNNVERLYGIVPLSRFEMVAGRFVHAGVLGAAAASSSLIITAVSSAFSGIAVDWIVIKLILSIGILFFALNVSVCYPIYFRIPFSKANLWTMLPMILMYVGVLLLTQGAVNAYWLVNLVNFAAENSSLVLLLTVFVSLALMLASMAISYSVRKKKEI
jgi:hypothetical protein